MPADTWEYRHLSGIHKGALYSVSRTAYTLGLLVHFLPRVKELFYTKNRVKIHANDQGCLVNRGTQPTVM